MGGPDTVSAPISSPGQDARPVLAGARTIPVLRSFSEEKAREFYLGFLGFKVDWEHRFEADAPLYMQISRCDLVFHLSEHHGDGSPGAVVFVDMRGLDAYHAEISAKRYRNMRPDIQTQSWGRREMTVIDPSGNRIRFSEPTETT